MGKNRITDDKSICRPAVRYAGIIPCKQKTEKTDHGFFDKDRAGEVGIRAMGGSYYRVKEGEPTGWNPAALPPTKRNIAFIEGPGEAALYSQQ
nr:hypothetical protein [Salmonella enterica]